MEVNSSMEASTKPASGGDVGTKWQLWLVAILLGLVYTPTMLWLLERWTKSVWHHGHGILIMLVVVYLVWKELEKLQELPRSYSHIGFLVLVPALILYILDMGIHSQLLAAFALILSLPGLSLLFLGWKRTRVILFPLLALFLTLPIPLAFTESIHLTLRFIATDAVSWLLPYFGVPVFSTGTLLEIPNGSLQVADACSGFSTLYATVTVAVLTAYFCNSNYRRIAVLLVAVPLAIGVNIVRVLLLTLLVHWFGLDVLGTSAHEISGLLTFVVALPVVFWLGHEQETVEEQS